MIPLIIAVLAGALIFCIAKIIVSLSTRQRQDIEKRILELRAERGESEKNKAKPKRRRKGEQSSALAKTRKKLEKLENEIYDAGLKIPVIRFLEIWIALVFGITFLLPILGVSMLIACVAALAVAVGPILYIKIRKKKRKQTLEGQLVEAISVLCNALRAGHSFQSAMNNIASEMTGPISEEFGRVFLETQHGMTMADSFERLVERTGSEDLEMLCTAILIQRDIGGNLAEVLDNISGTVQARLSLKAEIKTRTASGRLSGYIVGALPILLLVALTVINPDYSSMLFETQTGHIMLGIGAGMEVIGFIVINKMVSVKY